MGAWGGKGWWTVPVMAFAASVAWLALVPWELSTLNATGMEIRNEEFKEYDVEILLAVCLPGIVCLLLARLVPTWTVAIAATFVVTTCFWYVYRSVPTRTHPDDPWLLGLILTMIPGTIAVATVTGLVGFRWARRSSR